MTAETLDERRARLRNGSWNMIPARQTVALVTYTRYGTKRPMTVYRAQASRWLGTNFEFSHCTHNHKRRSAADQCGAKLARQLNRGEGN